MKLLIILLATFSIAVSAQTGYPVYGTLKKNTYWVESGTAGVVEYEGKSYLVSNWHVCRNFKNGKTKAKNDYYGAEYSVKVLAMSPEHDICIMQSPVEGGLKIGKSAKIGDAVYSAGYPSSSREKLVLTSGVKTGLSSAGLDYGSSDCPASFDQGSSIERGVKVYRCYREFNLQDTTMRGEPGCSGSPMVNSKGELIGVINSTNNRTISALRLTDLYETFKLLKP